MRIPCSGAWDARRPLAEVGMVGDSLRVQRAPPSCWLPGDGDGETGVVTGKLVPQPLACPWRRGRHRGRTVNIRLSCSCCSSTRPMAGTTPGHPGTRCSGSRNGNVAEAAHARRSWGMFSDCVRRVTSCRSVKEIVMDVVVWTESEERERWWRAVVGIATAGDRCVATDVVEVPRRARSVTPRTHASGPSSLHAANAA